MRSSLRSCGRHFPELGSACDHAAEHVPELPVHPCSDLPRMTRLDLGDYLIAEPDLCQPPLGGEDQLRPAIWRVWAPFDIAELLELVDDAPDDLLVAAGEACQLGCSDAVLIEEGEHSAVAGVKVVVAGLGEPLE